MPGKFNRAFDSGKLRELKETIDMRHGLLDELRDSGVITKSQYKSIDLEDVEEFIYTLRRRPDEDYIKFCDALCKPNINQAHVVIDYLSVELDESERENLHRKYGVEFSESQTAAQDYQPNKVPGGKNPPKRLKREHQQLTTACLPIPSDAFDLYRLQLSSPLLLTPDCHDRDAVRGLATFDGKLFVLYWNAIDVYDTQSKFTGPSTISVEKLKEPRHIVACNLNSCLYVTEWSDDCQGVFKWKADKYDAVGKRFQEWLKIENVWSISVTSEGCIALLVIGESVSEGDKSFKRCSVHIYSADGEKLSSLDLPRDIVKPWHVIQTSKKSFFVCHGESESEQHRVCEVNKAGVTVNFYGGPRGSELGQLNTPKHIALYKEEQVFVSDFNNRRVLLLDSQLKLQLVLFNGSQDKPQSVIYDQTTTKLMVQVAHGGVTDVKITNFNFGLTHESYGGPLVTSTMLHVDGSSTFDDGKLGAPGQRISITGMKIYTREWDGHIVIGGLKVFYSTGEKAVHGNTTTDNNPVEFHLQKYELIVSAFVRYGSLLDSLQFRTSNNRTLGPFGGNGGNLCKRITYPHDPQHQSQPYLAYLKGRVDITGDDTAIRHLELVWGFYKCAST